MKNKRSTVRSKLKVLPKPPTDNPRPKQPASVHSVYSFLLAKLDLTEDHRQALVSRGLSPKEITNLNYRTFPTKRRELVGQLIHEFGRNTLLDLGVPGLWLNEVGELELAGKCGIAIPVRDINGQIQSIKIRVDKPSSASSKYLLLSSNPSPDKKTGAIKYPSGTSAKATLHFPLERPASNKKVLRITEGELKADIATSLTDVLTISIPGVGLWRLALDAIKALRPERVLLAFDSDKAQGTNAAYDKAGEGEDFSLDAPKEQFLVGKAVASLYLVLKAEAAALGIKELGIEDWPEATGKGIDDVLVQGESDKIRVMEGEAADAFAQVMLADNMPEGWVYVVGVKRFYHCQSLLELDKEQYADRYLHTEKGNPASNALRNPALPKVDMPIYMPNREMMYEEDGRKFFNVWRCGTLKPQEGDVAPFLQHAEYVIPDAEERRVFLDWLAFNVQFPGKKILWSMLLKGEPGTGKSYFGTLMRWLLGETNVSCPTNELIHEIYTQWAKSCQLIVIEEIMARGRLELMNKLKPMITQPTVIIREMNKPAYEQPNVFNLLMFTNHEDALLIDRQDRRYCVLFSPAKAREHAYYAALWDWTRDHKAAILDHLLKRDLSAFQPLAHAPMTAAKGELIAEGLTDVQAWVEEGVAEETWPFAGDLVGVNHLVECAPRNLRNASRQTVARALKNIGAKKLESPTRLKSGGQVRLWTIRRHEVWMSAEAATVAAEYERWSAANEPGGNPMMEARPM